MSFYQEQNYVIFENCEIGIFILHAVYIYIYLHSAVEEM